ncbi:MAG: 30S ribosome-binding factor RbfA [Actinomycetota bacterium]|uniref:Ribosome-binding factor A n=1 Tax=marine metagenome TaxID=408172 RepID=A0A381QM60_9ZZZZ|nr:30S ribosome-binding factor RbfA [Acidimicrobiales bacterium]MEC9316857.1 30S ribosome-binding factor RbfA [Actinomycetota bacterium]MEE2680148.1 30S ribosome-binding factor RbfA [Actinomycetota bacterium]MEE3187508.1 30S ribosome-binding factor RbfA [Actinomycetota bacterium]|tara:strand:+ start:463 stop:864 length:402 start_codon:yes stop_codon:yes gene_type:complete
MKHQRGRQRRTGQNFARTDRVAGLVREIVATELERIDDQRLFLLAVTGVDVDRELARATVWFDVLDEEDLPQVAGALEEHRQRIQQALASQSRMRRTPAIRFSPDPSIGDAGRIESILEDLGMGASPEKAEGD